MRSIDLTKEELLSLLLAIRAVESTNGLTSKNELQIMPICIRDVNRIYGTSYKQSDSWNRVKSEEIAILYLSYWAEQSRRPKTAELYARIWNGGPDGWKKSCTLPYWHKVKKQYERLKHGNS